jgi:hypothetical protein|tara:strand:+ start:178 stop:321 length:144 start_codon:yes stop_codon:yes gene_type:complete
MIDKFIYDFFAKIDKFFLKIDKVVDDLYTFDFPKTKKCKCNGKCRCK